MKGFSGTDRVGRHYCCAISDAMMSNSILDLFQLTSLALVMRDQEAETYHNNHTVTPVSNLYMSAICEIQQRKALSPTEPTLAVFTVK